MPPGRLLPDRQVPTGRPVEDSTSPACGLQQTNAIIGVFDARVLAWSLLLTADPMSASPFAAPHFGAGHVSPPATLSTGLALPKVLLCDLDGTLVDSMPTLAELATEVLGEVYGTPRALARELYIATCGLPFIRQLESIFPGDARNPTASDLFEGRKPARCNQIRMESDVEIALANLKRRGVAIVVSSNNGVENVAAFARNAGSTFDLVLGFGGGLAKGRPHIERAESVFGVDRSDMLFVGDSLHDGEIAEREAVPFVGLAGTFSYERFALRFPHIPIVRRFAEVPTLFGPAWAAKSEVDIRPVVGHG
jgi:phosphoglycolate phosphatase-like HAD superfamily hydrolase